MFKIILKNTLALLLSWFLVHSAVLVTDGLTDEFTPTDLIIVFGNQVQTNGQPSPRLESRLEKAILLYRYKVAPKILVSGGIGKEGFDEAKVMKEYLTEHQIPAQNIITDNEGSNTHLTAQNAAKIMKKNNFKSATLVSQYYHITRAKLAMSQYDINETYGAHASMTPEPRDFYSVPREWIAYYYYLFQH